MIVMGRMKFSSESIPASSEVFWNRFRIVVEESVSEIGYGTTSGPGIVIGSEIRIGLEIVGGFGISIRIGIWIQGCYVWIAAKNPNLLVKYPFSWRFSD